MNVRRRSIIYMVMAGLAGALFTACQERRVYDHFEQAPAEGWEQREALAFDVPPQQAGSYHLEVCVRTTQAYPYRNLALLVETEAKPSGTLTRDTVTYNFYEAREALAGRKGVSCAELTMPVGTLSFAQGDSVHVSIRHLMRRDCLSGVSDVGVIVSR